MKQIFSIFILMFLACAAPRPAHAEFDQSYIGDTIEYKASYEDTFVHLARDYNLGFTELRAANPHVDPWLPGEGTSLILPTRHLLPDSSREGIVINLPEMRLYAFLEGHDTPVTFPLGVGREGLETPTGSTKIIRKTVGPIWHPTPRMRKENPDLPASIPPGPENPLGSHALYFDWPEYAIHGTNRPFGIGRRISSGCIRMYPEDIRQFYEIIPVGTKVTVINQPIKAAWIDDKLYIEAHADMAQAIEMEENGYVSETKPTDEEINYIKKVAGEAEDRIDWDKVNKIFAQRRGYPLQIAERPQGYAAPDTTESEPAESPYTTETDAKKPPEDTPDGASTNVPDKNNIEDTAPGNSNDSLNKTDEAPASDTTTPVSTSTMEVILNR